jgi:hypothetical protein
MGAGTACVRTQIFDLNLRLFLVFRFEAMCDTNEVESGVDLVTGHNPASDMEQIKEIEFSLVFNKDRFNIKFDANKKVFDLKVHIESLTSKR